MHSLPRLPPMKTSGVAKPTKTQQTFSSSPFSTPVIKKSGDEPQLLTSSNFTDLDSPHQASTHTKTPSKYASKFQTQSKADFVHADVSPLLERFEDTALYRHPQRKSLQTVLDEMSAQTGSLSNQKGSTDSKLSLLGRQSSDLTVIHRQYRQNSIVNITTAIVKKTSHEQLRASALEPPAKIVPTRFLFDSTIISRASRCDYCQFAGGELECATCNVIAHARCYLAVYEREDRKTKLTFVVPTIKSPFSSWLCSHCHSELVVEYDERSADARATHLAAQRQVLTNSLTAYVRMTRDAAAFAAKKASIIRIQAALRGRLARQQFERLQRMRLKPYNIDTLRVRATFPSGIGNNLGLGISSSSLEELRLGNGFSCNPFLYVTVVAGNDEDTQLFCFETTVRKPNSIINNGVMGSSELDISWPEKMFAPGADGNATFCFTLLSKNGPNTFFLGQAVLRLLDTNDSWRFGLATELELMDHIEIFPKTAQHQTLPLAHAAGNAPKFPEDLEEKNVNGDTTRSKKKPRWVVNVHLRPFRDQFSYCGYLNMKSTLESFHSSTRWCVLADGILRIYRHYGVTLASDVVDMARATDVRVVPIVSLAHRTATKKVAFSLKNSVNENVAISTNNSGGVRNLKTKSRLAEQNCLVVHHLSRLYVFQADKNEHLRQWMKKLQGAQKFSVTQ